MCPSDQLWIPGVPTTPSRVPQFAQQPTGLRETPVHYKGFLIKGMMRGTGEQPGGEASG